MTSPVVMKHSIWWVELICYVVYLIVSCVETRHDNTFRAYFTETFLDCEIDLDNNAKTCIASTATSKMIDVSIKNLIILTWVLAIIGTLYLFVTSSPRVIVGTLPDAIIMILVFITSGVADGFTLVLLAALYLSTYHEVIDGIAVATDIALYVVPMTSITLMLENSPEFSSLAWSTLGLSIFFRLCHYAMEYHGTLENTHVKRAFVLIRRTFLFGMIMATNASVSISHFN